MKKPTLTYEYIPATPRAKRTGYTTLAVDNEHADQIREIAYKTRLSIARITNDLIAYALENVELRETPVYEVRFPDGDDTE